MLSEGRKVKLTEAPRYPEYEPCAPFRCDLGCGTFARNKCIPHRGRLTCPNCRFIGTLRFAGRTAIKEAGNG